MSTNGEEQLCHEPDGMVDDFVANQDYNDSAIDENNDAPVDENNDSTLDENNDAALDDNHDIALEDNNDVVLDDNTEPNEDPENLAQVKEETVDPNLWTLPPDKDICTLEEIRRGQVINRVAPNECPVLGCGKKINEASLEPSPGTIASGLRTHVLFVHYANRKGVKKRKLGWSTKRRSSASPKKQFTMSQGNMRSSPMMNWNDPVDYDGEPENFTLSSDDMLPPLSSGSSLIHKNYNNQNRSSPPGSLLNKKIKQLSAGQGQQQSSLQSLMQATGMGFPMNSSNKYSPQNKQKGQDFSSTQKNFNQTTSSLFSILAGLTQQPQQQSQQHNQQRHQSNNQSQQQRNVKAAHSGNTISLSQCSKNGNSNNNNTSSFINNPPINSSLLTLLNEKISGNVASALQTQLKKNLDINQHTKVSTSSNPNSRATASNPNGHFNQQNTPSHDNNNYNNNGTSILNSLCSNNGTLQLSEGDGPGSMLNHFIESVSKKTGSNIGLSGIAEAKKIIEKFTTWLICSSQTIADHYIAPFAGEAPQQKPEISASDVILAYKMMQKSHPQ